ncbi:MAG: M20/M25/M40 family metallo-hydrolase [Candidatus Aminicenantes bacterium]|nr:M20/M25/M40 family metallo-hydrolase [Candidatus Aminicenantes bacterium]
MSRKPGLLAAAICLAVFAGPASAQSPVSDWDLLRQIVLVPGLSGQETAVMDWIQARLPKGVQPERDARRNLWFTVGTGRPHILFVAHADELGMTVDKISPLGLVRLKGRGGFLPQACEGRPFAVQTPKGPVDGVIPPRSDFDTAKAAPFAPEAYDLDVGASTETEARGLGIAEGQMVLFKKSLIDLASGVLAARAVDDRAGCAALLAAAQQTDWSKLKGRTITCAWSVEEETGLLGATELARVLKPDYVFAVDTFVSSDSPLENKRFGNARLGQGAVLRALDSSNIIPKPQLNKVLALAAARKIPVQVADSRGGNDGSVFTVGGAVDIPLSWPGAYAHSFIEKIDARDLAALTSLIKVIITSFQ